MHVAYLWLIPALPLAGFVLLAFLGARLSARAVAAIGVGGVGAAAGVAIYAAFDFLALPPTAHQLSQTLWTWLGLADLTVRPGLRLDALSLVMALVVTVVGFLIHLYSAEYMALDDRADRGYARFFAYMNLFVAMMLTLVLADDLLLLYLGWEGVGLCSYLLIGFWHQDPANGAAARKAFIVTRVGDTALAIGLFILVARFGRLDIDLVQQSAHAAWMPGDSTAVIVALLFLGGAVGKSAQLPLQTWLPDAMAGPTPVSALIHAATMVTAGVYLIARMHGLFELAPDVLHIVAVIGAATLLLAGCSALVQRDIKRVLAYSTISQLGYMFVALGVGAWSAAIFHLVTHAFFKALLFLAAGAVIVALHHEQDIFRMGGLRKKLPLVFLVFLIGGASLAGFPLVTAGFYSKEWILGAAAASPWGGTWLWLAGVVGALLTALYIFRLIFIVFFGEAKAEVHHRPRWRMAAPLVALAVGAVVAGLLQPPFASIMQSIFPLTEAANANALALEVVAVVVSLLGIALAYALFGRRRLFAQRVAESSGGHALHRFWFGGWGFDWLYQVLLVRPFVWLADINRADAIDKLYDGVAALTEFLHRLARRTQNGRVRWYAAAMIAGALAILTWAVWP